MASVRRTTSCIYSCRIHASTISRRSTDWCRALVSRVGSGRGYLDRMTDQDWYTRLGHGRCYVIAEAGSNHNRDRDLALQLIDVAAEAGADAVKFQLFRADALYPPGAGPADYLQDGEDIYGLIKRMELPTEWLPALRERSAALGLDLLVTPFDEGSADEIDPFVRAFKIASYELTHLPL